MRERLAWFAALVLPDHEFLWRVVPATTTIQRGILLQVHTTSFQEKPHHEGCLPLCDCIRGVSVFFLGYDTGQKSAAFCRRFDLLTNENEY